MSLNLNTFFPYQFSVLAQQVTEFIAQIYEKFGITKMEWRVLATIGYHNELSAREICKFTHLDKMQVSRAINKLIQSELLFQQVSSQDRRKNLLNLTAKGHELYQEIIPLAKNQEQRLLEGLTDQECEQLKILTVKLSMQLDVISNKSVFKNSDDDVSS
ncbi:MarR family winged helix-turn-helix transcriptional regulator [Psychromonas sp. MB-3u-54]|uniref:MarR family winged helix-turn-helix transcriptional regulator n=1 Tax=Psychromonas sp. MB-3u-54 TaxID=2058319 RepID=UPI001E5CD2CE|nr:MarR family transcriptional regulator [Psychromonas sp. MB-3u-54]